MSEYGCAAYVVGLAYDVGDVEEEVEAVDVADEEGSEACEDCGWVSELEID